MNDESEQESDVVARDSAAAAQHESHRLALLDAAARTLIVRSRVPGRQDLPVEPGTFRTPRWIAFHVITWAFAIAAVYLGWWQLGVSDAKHFDLQNFSYWIQWWVFALCAVLFWARAIHLARRPPPPKGAAGVVVDAPGTAIVRAGEGGRVQAAGPVDLVSPTSTPANPLVYRGYKAPTSTDQPFRSGDDVYHSSYNDYLWQIAMADGETPDQQREG